MNPMHVSMLLAILCLPGLVQAGEAHMIEPGHELVKGTHLKPYVAHYRQYHQANGKDVLAGARLVHLQQAMFPTGPGFRSVISMLGGDTVYDEHRFLKKDLSPVIRVISARSLVHQFEVYGKEKIQGTAINGDGSEVRPLNLTREGTRFMGGVTAYLLAGLPLEKDFHAVLPIFSSDLGSEQANAYLSVVVKGRETITAANGQAYETWVIERRFLDKQKNPLQTPRGPFPPSTLWLSTRPPYQIKAQYGPMHLVLTSVHEIPIIEEAL